MKVLVCGSRDFADPFTASLTIDRRIGDLPPESHLIHGDARGTDRIASESAERRGLTITRFPADWETNGTRAGIMRNLEMLAQHPDLVVAFWNGESRGTAHMIAAARKAGVKTEVIPLA